MEQIREMFAIIEEPRHESYIEHKLSDILILLDHNNGKVLAFPLVNVRM